MQGQSGDVCPVVKGCLAAGADAVWPGCDLWPEVPKANMEAFVSCQKGEEQKESK
jgi:[methyl-Co(III) methanol-specific corrinoid protein]:coenzyme M methyltransferase